MELYFLIVGRLGLYGLLLGFSYVILFGFLRLLLFMVFFLRVVMDIRYCVNWFLGWEVVGLMGFICVVVIKFVFLFFCCNDFCFDLLWNECFDDVGDCG